MMTLRTPRRRISPSTRKRYRAIRNFFKRTIEPSSQPDIEINSSIAVNVTDLNRKIVGLEKQLSEVSKTCREFIWLEGSRNTSSTRESAGGATSDLTQGSHQHAMVEGGPQELEAKILYQTPDNQYRQSEDSVCTASKEIIDSQNKIKYYTHTETKPTEKKKKKENIHKDTRNNMNQNLRYQSASENIVPYSSSSFHSLTALKADHKNSGYLGDHVTKRVLKREQRLHNPQKYEIEQSDKIINMPKCCVQNEERTLKHFKTKSAKQAERELDQEFIAEIIKRQYKPLKLFGKKESIVSQFSEPVCRDLDYINENTQEDVRLCSCCYRRHHSPKPSSNTRSVCDTRLYSSKYVPRLRYHRPRDAFNDSELYDLIPVKEKSSPKTRRKFHQDNIAYNNFREVLPSPRSHRPRLNLKSQFTESEDLTDFTRHVRKCNSPKRRYIRADVPTDSLDSDQVSLRPTTRRKQHMPVNTRHNNNKGTRVGESMQHDLGARTIGPVQEMCTMSSLQYPEPFDIENSTPKTQTQETISSDKTDRAICEIKDILQTFLQEIKKEASSSDKSDVNNKIENLTDLNQQAKLLSNNGYCVNNSAQCHAPTTFMPPFNNPCCYPILPMYPINPMMQNNCVIPRTSNSCTCPAKNEDSGGNVKNKSNDDEICQNETDELIKEIYKYVAQSPAFGRKQDVLENEHNETRSSFPNKGLTSRSVGASNQVLKQDVKVGTRIRCYSKSCEAIGSGVTYDYSSDTYSTTMLESQSVEATSETELSTELTEIKKKKKTKIGNVLRSFGLFKKKKEDTSVELSESTIDVKNVKPSFHRDRPPFRQNVTNYMMQGQEFYRPPPIPQKYTDRRYRHDNSGDVDPRSYGDSANPRNYVEQDLRGYEERINTHERPNHPGYMKHTDPHHYIGNPDPRACAARSTPRDYDVNRDLRTCTRTPHTLKYGEHLETRDFGRLDSRGYPPDSAGRHDFSERYHQDYQPPYHLSTLYQPAGPPPAADPYYGPQTSQQRYEPPTNMPAAHPAAAQYSSGYGGYSHLPSQVPLCLKEVEVKSMATQSERKLSFFRKIKQKMKAPEQVDDVLKNLATQTKQNQRPWNPQPEKPSLWKNWQLKAMEHHMRPDNQMDYFLQQQKIAAGDTNMRNAMIKKIFHKRNPFSPRNMIVKTLLGKDRTSYGLPPTGTLKTRLLF